MGCSYRPLCLANNNKNPCASILCACAKEKRKKKKTRPKYTWGKKAHSSNGVHWAVRRSKEKEHRRKRKYVLYLLPENQSHPRSEANNPPTGQ